MNEMSDATDTTDEAHAIQLACLRRMTPQQRLQKTLGLTHQVRKMAFDAIRRRFPDLDESGVRMQFIRLAYGDELAEEIASRQAGQTIE